MVTQISNIKSWACPNCSQTDMTDDPRPHTRYHTCMGLRGLTAPFVEAGSKTKVVAHDREDYVGNEIVPTDAYGRPVMSITTERPDGSNDTTVFAPTSVMKA